MVARRGATTAMAGSGDGNKYRFPPIPCLLFPQTPSYCRHIVQILRILCKIIIILLYVAVTSTYSEHWTNGDNMELHLI